MKKDKIEDLINPTKIKEVVYDYNTIHVSESYDKFISLIHFLEKKTEIDFVVENNIVEGSYNRKTIYVAAVDKMKAREAIKNHR